jgi:hypothetical protein
MGVVDGMQARLRGLLRRALADDDLDEEIRFHIEMETEKNVVAGMSGAEARRMAMARFGGVQRVREEHRDVRRIAWMEDAVADARFAARSLAPGAALAIILMLALAACQSLYPPAEFRTAAYGLVYGRVLLPDGQPAVGARVRNDLSYANATIADSAGQYRLALVAPGFGPGRGPIALTFFAPIARDGIADSMQTTVIVSLAASADLVWDSSRLDFVLGAGAAPH